MKEEDGHHKQREEWQKWIRAVRYRNEKNRTRGRCAGPCAQRIMERTLWPKFCGALEWPQFRCIAQKLLELFRQGKAMTMTELTSSLPD